jgi:hypothetical protein
VLRIRIRIRIRIHTYHFDAFPDPDPDPSFQIKAQSAHFLYILACHLQIDADTLVLKPRYAPFNALNDDSNDSNAPFKCLG